MKARKKRKKGIDTGYDPDPLRVIHVSTPMSWRGGEQQLAHLYRYLDRVGLQQIVLTAKGSAMLGHCQDQGWPYATFARKGPLTSGVAWELCWLSRSYTPDLIHVHDAHAHSAAFIATLFFGMRIPIIVHRRVDFPVGKNVLSRWKFDHPHMRCVIAVSEAIREIGREGVKQKEKWVTVHSGIDPELIRERKDPQRISDELGLQKGVPLIGNVAALADHKDHITFLRCARIYFDRGGSGHFVIIGEGPERVHVEEERDRLGLNERVSLLGFRRDLPELLSGFDIFLMSSKTEGLGTSVLDAMASGIPVVSTKAGGIPEMIEDGTNGLLRSVGDLEGLAEALFELGSDPSLRKTLVEAGKRTAGRFSVDRMGEGVLQSYHAVLRKMG